MSDKTKKEKVQVNLKGKKKFVAEEKKALPLAVGKKIIIIKQKAIEVDCDELTLPAKSVLRTALIDQDVKEVK